MTRTRLLPSEVLSRIRPYGTQPRGPTEPEAGAPRSREYRVCRATRRFPKGDLIAAYDQRVAKAVCDGQRLRFREPPSHALGCLTRTALLGHARICHRERNSDPLEASRVCSAKWRRGTSRKGGVIGKPAEPLQCSATTLSCRAIFSELSNGTGSPFSFRVKLGGPCFNRARRARCWLQSCSRLAASRSCLVFGRFGARADITDLSAGRGLALYSGPSAGCCLRRRHCPGRAKRACSASTSIACCPAAAARRSGSRRARPPICILARTPARPRPRKIQKKVQ